MEPLLLKRKHLYDKIKNTIQNPVSDEKMDSEMTVAPQSTSGQPGSSIRRSTELQIAQPQQRRSNAHPMATPVAAPRNNTLRAVAAPPELPPAETTRTDNRAPLRCGLCSRPHALHLCPIFRGMSPPQRRQVAAAHGYCLNCLAHTHVAAECTSVNVCQICYQAHHTVFHRGPSGNLVAMGNNRRRPPPMLREPQRGGRQAPVTTSRRRRSAVYQAYQQPQHRRLSRPPQTTHRHRQQPRSHHRRATGISNVVETLQQLQRLLC